MMVEPPRIRNGAQYYELLRTMTTSGRTTAIVDATMKLSYPESMFTVDLVTNSYKYGSEVQFKSYSVKPPTVEKRVDKEHSYYRLECGYLPATHQTAEKLREMADKIDAVIGYSYTFTASSDNHVALSLFCAAGGK